MKREIHIAPGDSAAGSMRQALGFGRADLLVHQDLLNCGPLLPVASLDEWRRVRQEYLRSLYLDWPDFSFDTDDGLLANASKLRDAEAIVLWIGTGAAEQLLLASMPWFLGRIGVPAEKLNFVQFASAPSSYPILYVGELNPDRIRAHPQIRALTSVELADLEAAWNAVTAPDPRILLSAIAIDDRSLPFLRTCLRSRLSHFPDASTGVNVWERRLLERTRDRGPNAARVVGWAITEELDTEGVSDPYAFARMRRLADPRLPYPFLELRGDVRSMRGCEVRLTEAAARALEGGESFIALNGIDDWVGGVHLDSARGNVWVRVADSLQPL